MAARKKQVENVCLSAFALLVAAIIIFPVVWILPAAFKSRQELFAIPNTFFPRAFTMENFRLMFTVNVNGAGYLQSLGVTALTAFVATALSLYVNMAAAYAFARLEFRGKGFFWLYVLVTMFIPGITILLTSIRVVNILNMNDTLFALFVPGTANAYNIFFFRQYFYSVPASLEESAQIDGASRWRIFFNIFIPMSITPMIIIGMGVFMGVYNSYIWPTLTVSDNPSITQLMQIINSLNGRYSGNYGVVIAAAVVALLLPVGIFAVFQKRFVRGIALAGLK